MKLSEEIDTCFSCGYSLDNSSIFCNECVYDRTFEMESWNAFIILSGAEKVTDEDLKNLIEDLEK